MAENERPEGARSWTEPPEGYVPPGPSPHAAILAPNQTPEQLAERDAAIDRAMAQTLAPHAHADRRLMAHATPEIREQWRAAVQTGKQQAQLDMQSAMSVMADGSWPALDDCLPPGSFLAAVDKAFVETTDIPRELPVFAAIHYVSALLLQRGVGIEIAGEVWRPDIWTICMADSGSGKSFATSRIAKALGNTVDMMPDSSSAAKFVEDLRDHNRGLWMRDEFAQFLRSMGGSDAMGEMKDYLLRCYDGSTIVRSTKAETVKVESPALTIYGSTVFKTIKDYLTREMLVDGFAPRFAFVVAERDMSRPLQALYYFAERAPEISELWDAVVAAGIHYRYRVSEVAAASFEAAFQVLLARADSTGVDTGFIKRVSHRGAKYALIYHVLLGKTTEWLDEEDFEYAAKLCALNLRDLRKVLDLYGPAKKAADSPQADDKLEKVAEYLRRARDSGWAPSDARVLQSRLRAVQKIPAEEVRALMRKAVEDDPSLAAVVHLPAAKASS